MDAAKSGRGPNRAGLSFCQGLAGLQRVAVVVVSAIFAGLPLVVFAGRFRSPFENSWLESLVLEQVRRLSEGKPLFQAPGLDFVPLIYTPLYYYAGAALGEWFGASLATLRGLSMACSAATGAILFAMVWRETRSRTAAAAALGLYGACYRLCGFWFDLARVDAMMLMLLMAGLYGARFGATAWSGVATGLLLGAAVLTKQTAAGAVVVVLAWLVWRNRWAGLTAAGCAGLLVLGSSVAWNQGSGGWYGYFVFTLPSRHGISLGLLFHVATDLFALPLGIALLLGTYALCKNWSDGERGRFWFYLSLSAVALAGGAVSLAKWGGYVNALLPGCALVAVLFGLGLHAVWSDAQRMPEREGRRVSAVASLAALAQMGLLAYNPLPAIPSAEEIATMRGLVRSLRAMEGEVFIPAYPYLAVSAGKPGHAHHMQLEDLLTHGDVEVRGQLRGALERAVEAGRFSAVIAHPAEQILPESADYWGIFEPRFRAEKNRIGAGPLRIRMDAGRWVQNELYMPVEGRSGKTPADDR